MASPGNGYGAVCVFDGENPRTFTARAREVISGGEFVMASGAEGAFGSGIDSYANGDVIVALSAATDKFNGIALSTVGSNYNVTVATRGAYILKCGGSVLAGTLVESLGDSVAVQSLTSGAVPTGLYTGIMSGKVIGRALTAGASGGYALIDLHP